MCDQKTAEKGRGGGSRQVCRVRAVGRPQRAAAVALDVTRRNKPMALLPFLIFLFFILFLRNFFLGFIYLPSQSPAKRPTSTQQTPPKIGKRKHHCRQGAAGPHEKEKV